MPNGISSFFVSLHLNSKQTKDLLRTEKLAEVD
jgi:hypothetical protein